MFVVPTMLPAMKTTTTNASQPQNAFLRCRPLQTAMRAARLCFGGEVDMPAPDACVRRLPLRMAPVHRPSVGAEDLARRLLWSGQRDHTPAARALPAIHKRVASALGGGLRLLGE